MSIRADSASAFNRRQGSFWALSGLLLCVQYFIMEVGFLTVALVSFLVIVGFMWVFQVGRSHNLPPGPNNPLAVLTIQRKVYLTVTRLAEKYGPVYSFRLGKNLVVSLNNIDVIREATLDKADSFSDRPVSTVINTVNQGNKGSILFGNGEHWKELRKFGANAFRNFGVGKRNLAKKISEEATYLISAFKEQNGEGFDPVLTINNAVSNIICSISFGERYDYENEKFRSLLTMIRTMAGSVTVISVLHCIPRVLALLIRYLPSLGKVRQNFRTVKSFVSDRIQEHKSSLDSNDVRDIIDMYLLAGEKQGKEKGQIHDYDLTTAWRFIMDLFTAGSDTTTNSLLWALAIFCHFPEVQEKIYQEIKEVVGVDRLPVYEEKSQMPYTEAVILEIQRFRPVVPLYGRENSRDDTIGGFFVPKGSRVLINIWGAGHDPTKWDNPYDFIPERFLSADGKTVVNQDSHIPFGIGRRVCLGETLAKTEVFLFLTSLVQRFRFRVPDGDPLPSLEGNHGVVLSPKPYKLCAELRA